MQTQQANEPRLMTVAEAADRLSVSPRTIYRAIRDGEFDHVKVGSATRVRSSVVDALLAARHSPEIPLHDLAALAADLDRIRARLERIISGEAA